MAEIAIEEEEVKGENLKLIKIVKIKRNDSNF